MRITFVGLFAALLLVAACETTPDEAASTAGAGGATEATGASGVAGAAVTPGTGMTTPDSAAVSPEAGAGAPAMAAITPDSSALTREPAEAGRAVGAVGAVTPGTQEDFVLNIGDTVYFDFDKSVLSPEAQRSLERQATWLAQFPGANVTVQGHADERGTREYNLALGERRATAVSNFLGALGVDGGRLSVISYGKERPAALGHTEAAWAQNRRGVTIIN